MTPITVVMACYQGEAYLPRQLASLRAQTDATFRVLMQDDGSADNTPRLMKAVCDEDERFAIGRENGRGFGAKGNFFSLMRQAPQGYTALCDQDDEWMPDRLSRCRAVMADAEVCYGADTPLLVHSDAVLIDEAGSILHDSFFAHQGWDKTAVKLPPLLVQNNVTGCTLMMNDALRRLVVTYGRPECMVMHDWFIALTAAAFGHVLFVDAPLVRYRQHGDNVQGASNQGLGRRGVKALSAWEKSKARIALTYTHAKAFRDAYGEKLPKEARTIIDGYLATQDMGKLRRVMMVRRMGCVMQSSITRMGQIIFG